MITDVKDLDIKKNEHYMLLLRRYIKDSIPTFENSARTQVSFAIHSQYLALLHPQLNALWLIPLQHSDIAFY